MKQHLARFIAKNNERYIKLHACFCFKDAYIILLERRQMHCFIKCVCSVQLPYKSNTSTVCQPFPQKNRVR